MSIIVTCPRCGSQVEPVESRKGNMRLQILLWFCFVLPGWLYSIWRESTKKLVCPDCEYSELKVPVSGDAPKKFRSSATQH